MCYFSKSTASIFWPDVLKTSKSTLEDIFNSANIFGIIEVYTEEFFRSLIRSSPIYATVQFFARCLLFLGINQLLCNSGTIISYCLMQETGLEDLLRTLLNMQLDVGISKCKGAEG